MEKEIQELIPLEIKKLGYQCKQNSIPIYTETLKNSILFKPKNFKILFILSYLKRFETYSLTIDFLKEDSLSSSWNLFTTLPEPAAFTSQKRPPAPVR